MPHADNLVSIDTAAETGAPPLETKQTLALVGHADEANLPPDIEFNTVYRYSDPASVALDFGEGSKLAEASAAASAEQASTYQVVLLERTEQTETLAGTEGAVSSPGTVSDVPMSGVGDVTVTVDGGEPIVSEAVTTSPPFTEGGGDPEPGTAIHNPDTGEVKAGDETSGAGPGIEATFSTLSWTDGLRALRGSSADIVTFARERYDRSYIGDQDELNTWASANDVTVIQPYARGTSLGDGRGQDSILLETDLAHDVGAYAPCRFALPIANSSTDAIGAAYAGRLAVEDPWYDPFMKTMELNSPTGRYTPGNIGAPELPGSFEGGEDGAGMANVLHNSGGTVLSNSLTTAGAESPYRYIDIPRSEAYLKVRARDTIKRLLRDNVIRFDKDGKIQIEAALNDEFQPLVGQRDSPFTEIVPVVPDAIDLSVSTRLNRIWTDIELIVVFAPTVHRAELTIITTLADTPTAESVTEGGGTVA